MYNIMSVVNQIFNNGKILNYKPETNLSIDMFIFGKTNIVDQLNIFNFEQDNPNDFILEVNSINKNIGPPDIFNSNNIIIQKNINIYTSTNSITNILNNEGMTYVKNNIYLEDKYIASNYIIKKNLISNKNLNISNTNRFSDFTYDMNIKQYNNLSLLINQDFIVKNNIITKKNVFINNNLETTIINYNNVNINNNLKIFNNFNSSANLNINVFELVEKFNTNDLIVNDSIIIKNNELFLPKISIHNNIDGSLRLNNKTNNIEAYIKNNWNVLNTLQNIENTSSITHQEHFKKHIGTNIDFIQNHNTTMSINNNNKVLYINHKNVNMNNIYIANNLNIHNKYNVTNNINITGSVFINNNLLVNNGLLVINSNNNSSINGALRFNNITNCYEVYINRWQPLQQITNNNNTSNIELYPNNNYNSILFNLNNSIVLNINKNNCLFNRDIYVEQNVNLYDNLKINNNLNTINLNINTNNIYENNGELYNKFGKLGYENMFTNNTIDLDITKYVFYSSNITNTEKHCNIVDPIVLNKFAIINSSIFIESYKIYNSINITKFVLYFNQKIKNTIIVYINDLTYNCNVEDSNNAKTDCYIFNTNIVLNKNTDLKVKIKSTSNIDNLQAIIYLYGTYKNVNGILLKNNSSTIIDTNNIFTDYNKIIQGNTIIKNNLNILNNHNNTINHLHSNTIGIGTNNKLCDFIVKNKSNTILIHKNNNIGINTTKLTAKLNIHSNNITIDKNFNCLKTLIVSHNINNVINLNIKNNLIKNNLINYNIDKSITFLNNITNNYNINIRNNITVSNIAILPNLTNCSNIIFNNNTLKYNINSIVYNINYFPGFNNNNIYLEENTNINFKYKNRNLLNITPNIISTNNDNLNESYIFSVSNNFNISKNSININTHNFIVNNISILDKLNSIESYCYCPHNLGITKTGITSNSFYITYNRPMFYYNLNNSITHQPKNIDYIGFQFCLGNNNNHYHPNWNTNSLIYYKNNIAFKKNKYDDYNSLLNIGIVSSIDYLTSNIVFNFNNNNNITYNNIINTDKVQLIYNNNTVPIFEKNLELNKSITLRALSIYTNNELYYSDPVSFTQT